VKAQGLVDGGGGYIPARIAWNWMLALIALLLFFGSIAKATSSLLKTKKNGFPI
jgi:hypothetical protein